MADISYNKTTWVNGSTALNAANLNNIEMGVDNATKAINNKVDKVAGKGLSTNDFNDHYKNVIDNLQGEGGISVIELTNKSGTIASAQLGEINANPQNFAFKYNGKILLFTKVDSTTYQYCNNTTSSSDNNVATTSALLTITLSTGVYTIAENVHNVVANSIHPANGGDLTNIQVGSKVYSIPSGGGVGVIELSDSQVQSINSHDTITFTAEQANLIKQDNIGFIVAKYQGSSFYKLSVSKATIGVDSIYTLGGFAEFAEFAPGFPFAITLSVADFTQPAKILYRGLPEHYLSTVEIGGDDSLVFSQNDDVKSTRKIYVDKINGDPIIHNNIAVVRDHSFVENKVVSFLGKYSVLIPDYSTDVTILPCDGDDNGKVLSVVNGEAQWASAGGVTVTFED